MRLHSTLLAVPVLALSLACSSGLGNNVVCSATAVGSKSGNLTTGLFFGFALREPVTDHAAAGGWIPGASSLRDRNVIFYAFVSESPADDAASSGSGRRLDRDGLADPNGAADVFVAAVVDGQIDERAFSYSLAGKFRHPRCTSCHSLVEPDTTVFDVTPHPGLPPGDPGLEDVPESPTNLCMSCHRFSLDTIDTDPFVLGFSWRNPARSIDADFRKLSTFQLAQRARLAPNTHFGRDRRVLWALESGVLTQISPAFAGNPFAPGATGFVVGGADDDHDGVDEPFDHDGRRRTVPGGRADFLTEVEAFRCGGPADTRDAIADVVLVSRRTDAGQAASGPSTQPDLTFVPDGAYVAGSAASAGTLHVAFTSTANDIVPGVVGSLMQVYRATYDVRVRSGGAIDLVYQTTVLVSNAGAAGGNGDSHSPSISASGDRIAFASDATDIDAGGGGTVHVYVRQVGTGAIERISEGGTSDSLAPSIDSTGTAVAFESTHVFDGPASPFTQVYFAELDDPALAVVATPRRASVPHPFGGSATTGDSYEPDVIRRTDEEILVAFTSENDLDRTTAGGSPAPATNVYVFRESDPRAGNGPSTTLVSAAQNVAGSVELPDDASRAPAFVGRASRLLIETDATNLDSAFPLPPDPQFGAPTFKSGDENGAPDVVMLNLTGLLTGSGAIRAEAISVSPAGAFGDRASLAPVAGAFPAASAFFGFAGLRTLARNIGAADNHVGLAPGDATPWLSFIEDEAPCEGPFDEVLCLLRATCLGCHVDQNGMHLGNLDRNTIRDTLVNDGYLVRGNRNASLMYQRMDSVGPVMPPSGELDQGLKDVVGIWIDTGAFDDDD